MKNPTHPFSETNIVLQLVQESRVKSKTVISCILWKKKDNIFYQRLFCSKESFLTFAFCPSV